MDLREKFEWAQQALSFYDFEQAEKIAWEIREARPDLAAVYLLLGNIYTNTKRHQDAVNAYQQAVELESDSIEGLNNLGIAYRKIGKLRESLDVFEKAHTLATDRADITYNLANCRKELGDRSRAENLYRQALARDPDFLMAYNNLGNLLQHQGKTDDAIRIFREGLEHDPNHPMLRYNLGIALEGRGLFEEAIQEYRRSLKSKPGWGRALNNLGVSLQKTEHYQEAEQVFHDLLKVEKNNIQAHNNIGVLLVAQQKFEEAEQYFEQALSYDPAYRNAALNLGKLHVESGAAGQALKELQALVKQEPDNHAIRFELATLLFRSNKENAALNETINLLHTEPNNPDYLLLLGKCRRKLGSHGKALPPLEKALRLRPEFENALVELAGTLSDMSRHDEAVRRLEAYLESRPDSFQIDLCRAETELDRDALEEAREEFGRLNDQYPKNERILKGLLNTFRKLGNREESLKIAEELVHILGDPQQNTDLDRLQAGLQLYEQIMSDLEENNPHNWQDNLKQLLESEDADTVDQADELEQELTIQSDEDIEGEMVPIIDVGGIEPVIAVNEEEGETISLMDAEEDIEPPEEDNEEEEEPEKIAVATERSDDTAPRSEPNYPPWPQYQPPQYQPPQYQPPQYQPPPPQYQAPPPPPQSPQPQPAPAPPIQQIYTQAPPQVIPVPVREIYRETPRPKAPEAPRKEAPPKPLEEEKAEPLYPQDLDTLEGALIEEDESEETPGESPGGQEEQEKPENRSLDQNRAEGLFDYLSKLTEYLPEEERKQYVESDMRLRMEALRSRLSGRGGLHSLAVGNKTGEVSSLPAAQGQNAGPAVTKKSGPTQQAVQATDRGTSPGTGLGTDRIGSTFEYLHDLSSQYPNPEIGEVLKRKMRAIIGKLKDSL